MAYPYQQQYAPQVQAPQYIYAPQPAPAGQLEQLRAAQYQAPAQQSSSGIIWVQGEEGAKAYMVAPGSSVMLMDSEGSAFYIKSADASGMPMPLRIFDYTERAQKQPQQPQAPSQATMPETAPEIDSIKAELASTRDEIAELRRQIDSMRTSAPVQARNVKTSPKKEDNDDGK